MSSLFYIWDENEHHLNSKKYTEFSNPKCFVGGALVHTDKGLVQIKNIKVGDMVLSKDESGEGELVYKPVTRTIKTENVPVCFVSLPQKL